MSSITFHLNGIETSIEGDTDGSLLNFLRGTAGLTGTHFGCGSNECGACNVLVGDHAIAACDTPLWAVAGEHVTTVEGLGNPDRPHPLQRAFIAEQAMQCGYCIP